MREDYETLRGKLGMSDDELRALNLWEPASGAPDKLAEVYIRRSKKREDVASLRGHLREIVQRAAEIGVSIRHVWFEQLSASKRHVTRREYASALQAVLDGKSKTFMVWKLDRFDRRGAGSVLSAVDELDLRKARLVTFVEHLDSTTVGARMFIAIYAEQARGEAEAITTRVQGGITSHKAEGRHGPGFAPYGLVADSDTGLLSHHPDEYPHARRVAEMILDRHTPFQAAQALSEDGVRTRNGKLWSRAAITKLVQLPQFAGMVPNRERQLDEYGNPTDRWLGYGEPLYDSEGNPITCGQGVISQAEFFAIRAVIRERRNEFSGRGKRAATYLLSGVLRCDACGGAMVGTGGRYHCMARRDKGAAACLGVASMGDRLDSVISEAWVSYVSALEPDDDVLYEIGRRWLRFTSPETESAVQHAQNTLESAQSRLTALSDRYWNPPTGGYVMPEAEYERQAAKLSATIADLQRAVTELTRSADVGVLLDPELLSEAWDVADTPMKRILLKVVWPDGIRLKRAKGHGDRTPIRDRLVFP